MNNFKASKLKSTISLTAPASEADASIFPKSVNAKAGKFWVEVEANFYNRTTGAMDNPTGIRRMKAAVKAIKAAGGTIENEELLGL